MFPNVLTPSPLYQGMFRVPALPSHHSASFLMDNLLRDRQAFQAAALAAGQGFNPLGVPGSYPGYMVPPPEAMTRGLSQGQSEQNAVLLSRMFPGGVPQGSVPGHQSSPHTQRHSAFLNSHAAKVH